MTEAGYRVKIWSQDEKKSNDADTLNKLQTPLMLMPNNIKLLEVVQRKSLELADLSPDEITEIMDFQKQPPVGPAPIGPDQQSPQQAPQPAPQAPQVAPQSAPAPAAPAPKKPKKKDGSVDKLKKIRKVLKKK